MENRLTVRFGPAGNCEDFYEKGYKSTVQAPEYLEKMGLDAYEYSCGRGVLLKQETAEKIGPRRIIMSRCPFMRRILPTFVIPIPPSRMRR